MSKKLTKTTVKTFIKNNALNLQIRVDSHFDSMIDCVSRINGAVFESATETGGDMGLGYAAHWCDGRTNINEYETDTHVGYEIYNCVGCYVLAVCKFPETAVDVVAEVIEPAPCTTVKVWGARCSCNDSPRDQKLKYGKFCAYHDGELGGEIKATNPPIGGIYESNHPKYAGFVIKEKDAGFCYFGGMGDWIVYAMPINQHGDPYYINEDAQRFMMGRDVGDFIPDEIEVSDECYRAVISNK